MGAKTNILVMFASSPNERPDMTVLVTGGCGYIGAHVVHALHQAGERVVVVDDLSYGKPTRIEGSRLYGMDIAAPGAGEDRKSTRLNSSHIQKSRMPSSA